MNKEEFGRKAWNEMNSGEDGALEQNRGGGRDSGEVRAAVPTRDAERSRQGRKWENTHRRGQG